MGARPPDTANSTGHVGLTDAGLSRACLTHAGLPKKPARASNVPSVLQSQNQPQNPSQIPYSPFLLLHSLCDPGPGRSLGNVRRVSPLTPRGMTMPISSVPPSTSPSPCPRFTRCVDHQPPEPLLTPNPMVPFGRPVRVNDRVSHQVNKRINDRVNVRANDRINVRVSFLVGLDGQVQSAFVLDSGGSDDDSAVLRAVRGWRYRPARCNGVPTSSEIRVRFSIHDLPRNLSATEFTYNKPRRGCSRATIPIPSPIPRSIQSPLLRVIQRRPFPPPILPAVRRLRISFGAFPQTFAGPNPTPRR